MTKYIIQRLGEKGDTSRRWGYVMRDFSDDFDTDKLSSRVDRFDWNLDDAAFATFLDNHFVLTYYHGTVPLGGPYSQNFAVRGASNVEEVDNLLHERIGLAFEETKPCSDRDAKSLVDLTKRN